MTKLKQFEEKLQLLGFDDCIVLLEKIEYHRDLDHLIYNRMLELDAERFIQFSKDY